MSTVYLFIVVLSGTALAADLTLRYVKKTGRLGWDKKWTFKKGRDIPVEQFLPDTISKLNVFFLSFSASGEIFLALGIVWYLTLPFGIMTAMLINFLSVHFLFPARERLNGTALPKNYLKSGDNANVSGKIPGDGYGKISIIYNERKYEFPALSANETDIDENLNVIIVAEQDGIFWVETEKEVFKVLYEKD